MAGNLQKFDLDRVPKVKTLEDLLQDDETSENHPRESWIDVQSNASQRYRHARWFDSDLTFC
jgi:hypothetical protein